MKFSNFFIIGIASIMWFIGSCNMYNYENKIKSIDENELDISLETFDSYLKWSIKILYMDSNTILDSTNSRYLILVANTLYLEKHKIKNSPSCPFIERRAKKFRLLFYGYAIFDKIVLRYGKYHPLYFKAFDIYYPPFYNKKSNYTIKLYRPINKRVF